MNTLIVPIDFSETSANAVRYAAGLSVELSPASIVLYHSMVATDTEVAGGSAAATDAARLEADGLAELAAAMAPDTEVAVVINDGLLLEQLQLLVQEHNALLIVMGITGKNKLEQKLIGSNTTKVAQQSGCPVLIIPDEAIYEPITDMVLTLEFKESLLEKVPAAAIRNMVVQLGARLSILNIEHDSEGTPPQYVRAGQQAAHVLFDSVEASFVMLEHQNVVQGITDYVAQHDVQLIVSIAEEHGFLNQLLKGSTTNKLAYTSDVPLLVFKALV